MTLHELMDDYKKQSYVCANVNYSDKKSVKANNSAAKRMYAIVEEVKSRFGNEGIEKFSELLECSIDKTNIWVAAQLLERASVNEYIKDKALKIIKKVAAGNEPESLGFQMWLKNYQNI